MSSLKQLRRFWDEVNIHKTEEKQYQILLDQRPITLPQKSILYASTPAMAEEIAKEWRQTATKKGDPFSFEQLPITQMMGTMIEKIVPNREMYIDTILPYMNGDLLCYFSDSPQKLVEKQNKLWKPLILWGEDFFQCSLTTTIGIMPIQQSQQVNIIIRDYLAKQNDHCLTAFAVLVPILNSIIATAAVIEGKISDEEAFDITYLDEITQSEIWGYDSEQQVRLDKIKQNIHEVSLFLKLSK